MTLVSHLFLVSDINLEYLLSAAGSADAFSRLTTSGQKGILKDFLGEASELIEIEPILESAKKVSAIMLVNFL